MVDFIGIILGAALSLIASIITAYFTNKQIAKQQTKQRQFELQKEHKNFMNKQYAHLAECFGLGIPLIGKDGVEFSREAIQEILKTLYVIYYMDENPQIKKLVYNSIQEYSKNGTFNKLDELCLAIIHLHKS